MSPLSKTGPFYKNPLPDTPLAPFTQPFTTFRQFLWPTTFRPAALPCSEMALHILRYVKLVGCPARNLGVEYTLPTPQGKLNHSPTLRNTQLRISKRKDLCQKITANSNCALL